MALAVPIQNSGSSGVSPASRVDSAETKTIAQSLANDPEADRNKRHLGFGGIGIGVGLFGGGFSPYDHYGYGGHYGGHEGYYGGYGGHFGGGPYGYGGPHGFGSPYGYGGLYGPPYGGGYANGYHYGYGSGFSSGFFG
ncbi:keratin-associated protein 19-2-like [Anopheles marshallii]|uniref:keratin-associated protein 19-2-like n=1 Tax=Anopheles marshallii TaxID=1521116 RepID=UPI00237AA67F|nr:keratin-associated protein 19-2-like [Anopheles marshallii]